MNSVRILTKYLEMYLLHGVRADPVGGVTLVHAGVVPGHVGQDEGGAGGGDVGLGHLVVALAPAEHGLRVAPRVAGEGDGGALLDHDLAVGGLGADGRRH